MPNFDVLKSIDGSFGIGDDMSVDKQSLKVIDQTFAGLYSVKLVLEEKTSFWYIILTMMNQKNERQLEVGTARGEVRYFRNFLTAITYMQINCKNAVSHTIEVQGVSYINGSTNT